ncbi:MAG: DUF393 domain-containing protein [Pseudomonadota bacterium]
MYSGSEGAAEAHPAKEHEDVSEASGLSSADNGSFCTYYNGACPVCSSEMKRYMADDAEAGGRLAWTDVSSDENVALLDELGITQDMAYRYLYVRDENGTLLRGVDAFAAIWERLPQWRFMAKIIRLPVVYQISCWGYDHVVSRTIYEWNRWRIRRAERRAAGASQSL